MINHGDITQIHGGNVEAALVVIGGSPCQDLSVAGKRAGLTGERSGLFMDQIRIIKEMREHDRSIGRTGSDVRPRWMVWENVPGALSSPGKGNAGDDFRAVLEETARVAEEETTIPRPAHGKWKTAGCIMGDGWSIAWRVLDAQYWGISIIDGETGLVRFVGTPQRRRRIALVADFGGSTAHLTLFSQRGSLSGDSKTGGETREETAGAVGEGVERAVGFPIGFRPENVIPDVADTLKARHDGSPNPDIHGGANVVYCLQGNGIDRSDTAGCNGRGWREDVSYTLNTIDRPAVYAFKGQAGSGAGSAGVAEGVSPTLLAERCGFPSPCVCYDARGNGDGGTVPTLTGDHGNRVTDYTAISVTECRSGKKTVRRLMPCEWERLQGLPDGWTDVGEWTDEKGKKHDSSDSARYKALGNSIALPPWRYVLSGIYPFLPDDEKTMASLFDGIGGFPLIWRELGGVTVWVSEIEPFCCAVTERRFGGYGDK